MSTRRNFKLTINPEDQRSFGPCDCCGNLTQRIWGYVREDEAALAAYFVEWTPGHTDQPASFDLIIGNWGDATSGADRVGVSLDYRLLESRPGFMIINAADRPFARSNLVGAALAREQVIGTKLAQTAFAICDVIFQQDPRLKTLPGR